MKHHHSILVEQIWQYDVWRPYMMFSTRRHTPRDTRELRERLCNDLMLNKTPWIKLNKYWDWGSGGRDELWVGYGHHGDQSGAKWGWISSQTHVPPFYPLSSPVSTLSKPHRQQVPLLSGVIPPVALQWHQHQLSLCEWREKQREWERGALHVEGSAITAHILWLPLSETLVSDDC